MTQHDDIYTGFSAAGRDPEGGRNYKLILSGFAYDQPTVQVLQHIQRDRPEVVDNFFPTPGYWSVDSFLSHHGDLSLDLGQDWTLSAGWVAKAQAALREHLTPKPEPLEGRLLDLARQQIVTHFETLGISSLAAEGFAYGECTAEDVNSYIETTYPGGISNFVADQVD